VLKGVKVGPRTTKTTIVAYANDITILVTEEDEISALRNAIMCYQEASGARINLAKSKAMAAAEWKITTNVMGIKYQDETRILGVIFHKKKPNRLYKTTGIR
jgi:hypothetical protein